MKVLSTKLAVIALISTMMLMLCSGCGSKEVTTKTSETVEKKPEIVSDPQLEAPYYPKEDKFAGGDGSKENPYQVATAGQLALMAHIFSREAEVWKDYDSWIHYDGAFFEQTADIVINDPADMEQWGTKAPAYNWESIGSHQFTGTFDGNGYTISGLYIYEVNLEEGRASGLFENTYSSTIRNVTLLQSYINADCNVGGIVGDSNSSCIENCYSEVVIDKKNDNGLCSSGGIVGTMNHGTIADCVFSGKITAMESTCGGIVGHASDISASACVNKGLIESLNESSANAGGIFGTLYSGADTVIEDCRNEGSVSGLGYCSLGGIVGLVNVQRDSELKDGEWIYTPGNMTLRKCINNGKIDGSQSGGYASVGGIVGQIYGTEYSEWSEFCTIENCINNGEVTARGLAGGMAGSSTIDCCPVNISECTNNGKIISESCAGGIMGRCYANQKEENISNCINKGEIESGHAGGILGDYFGFNTGVSEDGKTYIKNCANEGTIRGNHIGGIVGAGMDILQTVYIDYCMNQGDILGSESVRGGGILGVDAVASLIKTDVSLFMITNCVNLGNISQGTGKLAFDTKIQFEEKLKEGLKGSADGSDVLALILGGKCIGGIAGSVNQSIVENCINCGKLFGDEKVCFVKTYIDICNKRDEESDMVFLQAGGICGQYVFSDDIAESIGMINCTYETTAPISHSELGEFGGEETIVNVKAVEYADALILAEKLMDWR